MVNIFQVWDARDAARKNGSAEPVPAGGGGPSRYGLAALEREAARVRAARVGTRNSALNEAAFCLGQLVAGGELPDTLVVSVLTDAAQAVGLETREIEATVRSGLAAGEAQPRTAPQGGAGAATILDPATAGHERVNGADLQSRQTRQSDHLPSDGVRTGKTAGETVPVATIRPARSLTLGAPTTWLARATLPRAGVAVLVGEEGIGKSLWWVLVAAHVTTGMRSDLLGIPQRDPADVVLVLTEDSWPDVRARLELAGADLDRVHVISIEPDGSGSPTFPVDFIHVGDGLRDLRPALIVVDCWLDTVAGNLQVRDTQQARQALHPWREAAAATGATVLLIGHTNRLDTGDLRAMVAATAALRQKARVLMFALAGPPETGGVVVGPDKSNHSTRAAAVRFEVDVQQVRPQTDDDPGTVARLRPVGSAGATIRDLFTLWKKEERAAAKPPTADEEVQAWARVNVHDGTPVDEAKTALRAAGHSPKRLTPAVQRLGGTAAPSGPGQPWVYRFGQSRQQSFQSSPRHWKGGQTGETGETAGQAVEP